MSRRPHRTTLGPHFNEGARLLWLRVAEAPYDGSQNALALAIDVGAGLVSRWLYGDRKPGRAHSATLHQRLGIPASAWDEPASVEFVLPATIADETSDDAAATDSQPSPEAR